MMTVSYDLHIHSALSPCADLDMTPGNIVAMAALKGLQIIAVTDHQCCGNCAAVMLAAEKQGGPVVLPGLEIESSEEIHLLCLLPDLTAAQMMECFVQQHLPELSNRPLIFGEQLLFDSEDHQTGSVDRLLLQPCRLDCQTLAEMALGLGGVLIPAHVDRDAYSMLQTLGAIPVDYPTNWLEYSSPEKAAALFRDKPELAAYRTLFNSDAHHLKDIAEAGPTLDLALAKQDLSAPEARQRMVTAVLSALRP